MRLLGPDEFLGWAGAREIQPDSPHLYRLEYRSGRRYSRFWVMPEFMGGYPHFVATMLDGLGPWESCVAWFPRGKWPGGIFEWSWPSDDVRTAVLRGFGIPDQFAGAVEFGRDERGQVLTLAFLQMMFGGGPRDDVHLIPDHGRAFLKISHHEVVHATFRRPGLIPPFVAQMEQHKFPLPTAPPDATFYRPRWMKKPNPA